MDEADLVILRLAGRTGVRPGPFEALVRAETGLSLTRFHQRVNVLIDDPAALAAEPQLVWRLRRLRQQRRSRASA